MLNKQSSILVFRSLVGLNPNIILTNKPYMNFFFLSSFLFYNNVSSTYNILKLTKTQMSSSDSGD